MAPDSWNLVQTFQNFVSIQLAYIARCSPIFRLFDTLLQPLELFYHEDHSESAKIEVLKMPKFDFFKGSNT